MVDVSRRTLLAGTTAAAVVAAVPEILSAASAKAAAASPTSTLKAFAVLDTDEWNGDIYFAPTEQEARRQAGVAEHDEEFFECRREPWADHFADAGKVPAHDAVVHGWRFECHGCGRTVSDAMEDWVDEADDRWWDRVDPGHTMDVYELASAYAREGAAHG